MPHYLTGHTADFLVTNPSSLQTYCQYATHFGPVPCRVYRRYVNYGLISSFYYRDDRKTEV